MDRPLKRILVVHNTYQLKGGEDSVVENEVSLLESMGNEVKVLKVDNTIINNTFQKVLTAFSVVWSFNSARMVTNAIAEFNPDVVHVHNYFPLISPSVFHACKQADVPVVHTLHNYRAVCPTAILMHDGHIQEQSIKNGSWWAIPKKVYRDSYIGTAALVCMIEFHKRIATWHNKVDKFIALTEFSKNKFNEAGWPIAKLVIKPNFVEDPMTEDSSSILPEPYALYVGRLSEEKGIECLLKAWRDMDFPLKIIGDGPLKDLVVKNASGNIHYEGLLSKDAVLAEMKSASFLMMPSTWYEGFPMVLVEALACGTPAIVSKLGSMEEIIEDGVTGLHFDKNNEQDLQNKVAWLVDNPDLLNQMSQNARSEYLNKYTPDANYRQLMEIYDAAIHDSRVK